MINSVLPGNNICDPSVANVPEIIRNSKDHIGAPSFSDILEFQFIHNHWCPYDIVHEN